MTTLELLGKLGLLSADETKLEQALSFELERFFAVGGTISLMDWLELPESARLAAIRAVEKIRGGERDHILEKLEEIADAT